MIAERREIVVVGAGPAGSIAARAAAQEGFSPLLIEKDRSPGAKNACGGLAAYALRESLALPEEVVERQISRLLLRVGENTRELVGARPTYISFRRCVFDAFLARRAVQAGAELLTATRVTAVDPASRRLTLRDVATGRQREVDARVVIFADGPVSLAAKSLGIGHRPGTRTRCGLFWEIEGSCGDGETAEVIAQTSPPAAGYVWIFPKRDCVNVGVGGPLRSGADAVPLRVRLERFVQTHPQLRDRKILRRGAGLVPCQRSRQLVTDGAMVVGDAAGLVNPLTGGGIVFSVLSGQIAGRVAAAAAKSGRSDRTALSAYPRRLRFTPHWIWLVAMSSLCRWHRGRMPSMPPEVYARVLKRYFSFFHRLSALADATLRWL